MITEEQKREFNKISVDNNSNLIHAVGEHDLEAVKYLMTNDFGTIFRNVNSRGKQAAFNFAANEGHLDIVKYFLRQEFKKSLNLKVNSNQALKQALLGGHIEVVKYMLTTLETKKHISIGDNIITYCRLAPAKMLEYLIFDYKMDISQHFNSLINDPYFIEQKPDAVKVLNYYQLQREIGSQLNSNIKEKKIKI